MNPAHLRTFLAVQKHLNYTHAARELLLSQPAVSRQIRQLELDLGVRLFEQIGEKAPPHRRREDAASRSIEAAGELGPRSRGPLAHQEAHRGALRIGASTTPGFYLLPSVLGRFHGSRPEVEISYSVENPLRIEHALLENEIDLGFVGTRLSNEDLLQEPVARDEIVFFAGSSHPLARLKRIELEVLSKEVWVTREKGSATRKLVDARLAHARISVGQSVILGCPEAVKALVTGGFGVSFLSIHGLKDDLDRGRVVKLSVPGWHIERTIYAVRHKDKHESPVLRSFLEAVKNAFRATKRGS